MEHRKEINTGGLLVMDINDLNDFGFSTFSEEPLKAEKEKPQKMLELIEPLIEALVKDSDKNPHIHWPNRKQTLTKLLKELKTIAES
jgi:hypothetical protein